MSRSLSTRTIRLNTRAVILTVAVFCFFALIAPHLVFAQPTDFQTVGQTSGLPTMDVAILIARIIRAVLGVIGIIFTIVLMYAGYLYLTAQGAPEPIKKAQAIFKNSIIGLIIIFSSYAIATFILGRLLDAAFTSSTEAIAARYAEPLSGSLGSGILEDHYPERDAIDIPRNTKIFVTFDEPINPATMIDGWTPESESTSLNVESVLIYSTQDGAGAALASEKVVVTHDDAFETWVFDPVEYLGSADEDTNYSVALTPNIERADGSAAFTGTYSSGYLWTFEVSTEVDLTPPFVVSVVPLAASSQPRNATIEMNFSEPMNPVAATGTYDVATGDTFTNIEAFDAAGVVINGTWEISNGYRTVGFTTTDACGQDPCGDTIYCLPGNQLVETVGHAAELNEAEIPQADPLGLDGLQDAAGNSLDGDNSGDACGSDTDTVVCDNGDTNDDYEWSFSTTDQVDDTVPQIASLGPGIEADQVSPTGAVTATFNTFLKSSTLDSMSISLSPDPWYEMWYAVRKDDVYAVVPPATTPVAIANRVEITHPALVSTDEGGWNYWPLFNQGIKSNFQICMYPAIGPTACSADRPTGFPYCCNGEPSDSECKTDSGDELPTEEEEEE